MAKNTLLVDFQDDIMNSSMDGKRRYKMINNSDGTISLEDATTYDQVGSNFGAAQLNATNQAVNAAADAGKIIDDLDAINNVTQEGYMAGALALKQVNDSLEEQPQFVYDEDGKITGYTTKIGGADTVFPFNCNDFENAKIILNAYKCIQANFPEACEKAIVIMSSAYAINSQYSDDSIVSYSISNVAKQVELLSISNEPALRMVYVEGATTSSVCSFAPKMSYTRRLIILKLA